MHGGDYFENWFIVSPEEDDCDRTCGKGWNHGFKYVYFEDW